jgi:tetratricopeptide (TPR) repeat protein
MRTLLAIALLASSVAHADKLEDAKAAFAVGKQAFERGEYEMALAQFQKAEALAPAPSLLYNIGRTYEALGRFREASQMYDKYLEQVGPPKNDQEKEFQNNLAARSAADKQRPDRGAAEPRPTQPQYAPPPPQYQQPYPYGYQPQPYPYYGYQMAPVAPVLTKAQEIDNARRRRGRAIGLTITGIVPGLIGIALMATGGGCQTSDCLAAFEATGVLMFLACPPFLIPGAVAWAKSQRKLDELTKMPDTPQPAAPTPQPAAPGLQSWIFSSPAFHF